MRVGHATMPPVSYMQPGPWGGLGACQQLCTAQLIQGAWQTLHKRVQRQVLPRKLRIAHLPPSSPWESATERGNRIEIAPAKSFRGANGTNASLCSKQLIGPLVYSGHMQNKTTAIRG